MNLEPELVWSALQTDNATSNVDVAFTDNDVEVDDFMLVVIASRSGAGAVSAPSGWTLIDSAGDGTSDVHIDAFYRVADGSADDTAMHNFSGAASTEWMVYKVVYRNVDPEVPIPSATLVAVVVADASPAQDLELPAPDVADPEPRTNQIQVGVAVYRDPTLGYTVDSELWTVIREDSGVAPTEEVSTVLLEGRQTFVGASLTRGVPDVAVSHNDAPPAGGAAGFTFPLNARRGRPAHTIADRIFDFLPPSYSALDLAVVHAGQLSLAEGAAGKLLDLTTVGGGVGTWLTLHGAGLGINRVEGESDASLRSRIRSFQDAVTEPAIVAALAATYADVTGIAPFLIEWFDTCFADVDAYCDTLSATVFDEPPAFAAVVPDPGAGDLSEAVHLSAAALANLLRAAGVRLSVVLPAAEATDQYPNRANPLGSIPATIYGSAPSSGYNVGMDAFTAANYLDVDGLPSGHTSNRRLWAVKFRWNTTSPGSSSPLLGVPDGEGGVAAYLTTGGAATLSTYVTASDPVAGGSAVGATLLTPNTNEAYWVFIEIPVEADSGDIVFAAMQDGAASLIFNESSTPTEDVGLDRIEIGRNTSTTDGPTSSHAGDVTILEVIEYDSDGGNFVFDVDTMLDIGSGANLREPRMIRRYNNLDAYMAV